LDSFKKYNFFLVLHINFMFFRGIAKRLPLGVLFGGSKKLVGSSKKLCGGSKKLAGAAKNWC
jgi:hypothetical protein